MYALTQIFHRRSGSADGASLAGFPPSHFHCAPGFATQTLAHMLDSLVRVSRRACGKDFVPVKGNKARSRPRWARGGITFPRERYLRISAVYRAPNRRELQRPHRIRTFKKRRAKDANIRHSLQQLPFQRFQALFNSLFKVLCIFPSRYLFAIGLSPIFSFRRNLPPA